MFEILSQNIDWSWARDIVFVLYSVTIVSITVIVVSENRNPVKSLAWVSVLLLLPMLGIVLYLFFGRNIQNHGKLSRSNRRRLRRRQPDSNVNYGKLNLSAESMQCIRLAHSLARAQIYGGNDIEVFTHGGPKFERLMADLASATQFINLEYYIIENDSTGNRIADILMERARAGVTVRIIYDDVGSFSVKSRFFKRMQKAGIQVYPFFEVTFPQLGTRINWRNHRKLCIIDGKVGYIGGMNIANRYIDGGKTFDSWRDTHLRIEGPAVSALQYAFTVDWHFMGQPLIDDPMPPQQSPPPGNCYAQVLTSGPTSQWSNIALMFHKAICNAKKRIYIQTPYFLPTDSLLKGLVTAALAGVDVRIMLPERSDSHMLDKASASYIAECLRAGIKIYRYNAGMLHSKMIIVDDDFVTVGSTNFDFRSFEHNFESNIFIYSNEFNARMLGIFADDLAHSTRITPQAWSKRPLLHRATESILRLFSPIL